MKVKKMKKKTRRKFVIVLLIIITLAITGIAGTSYLLSPISDVSESVTVTIERGSSLDAIAHALYDNHLVRNVNLYKIYVKLTKQENDLKAGTYTFFSDMDVAEITDKLVEGAPAATTMITIKEGLDLNRVGEYLEEVGLFTKDEFLNEIETNFAFYAEQYAFLADVPQNRTYKLEGYLFADTYEVYSVTTPQDVILKMLDRFDDAFKEEYYARCQELDRTIDEIVTMASLVEKEGILDSELPTIAGVFYNRLDDGMLLQSCATLQYIYKDYQFSFTSEQMKIDDPYNTYMYAGLPAGPISNFRETALHAALYPEDTDYYYFCTKNDGTGANAFAETLTEHNNNIDKYSGNWD